MWLAHGTESCWVADPATMTLSIHRAGLKTIRLTIKDKIDNDPVLPGLSLSIAKIFKRI